MNITEENYVDCAEAVMQELCSKKDRNGKPVPSVTTSKLRNLLALTADIYNEVMQRPEWFSDDPSDPDFSDFLDLDIRARIEYMRVRFVYECGREPKVKEFVQKAELLPLLKSIEGSKTRYILFSRYMEALVAFHRYYGGKDA